MRLQPPVRGMGANATTVASPDTPPLMQRVVDVQVNASEEPHARRRRLVPAPGPGGEEDAGMSLAQPLSDEHGQWDEGGSTVEVTEGVDAAGGLDLDEDAFSVSDSGEDGFTTDHDVLDVLGDDKLGKDPEGGDQPEEIRDGGGWASVRMEEVIPGSGVTVLEYCVVVARVAGAASKDAVSGMLRLTARTTPQPHHIPPSWLCVKAVLGVVDVQRTERHACPRDHHAWLDFLPKSEYEAHRHDACPLCGEPRLKPDRWGRLKPAKRFFYLGLDGVRTEIASPSFHTSRQERAAEDEVFDFWGSPLAQHLERTSLPGLLHRGTEWVTYAMAYDGAQVFLQGELLQMSHEGSCMTDLGTSPPPPPAASLPAPFPKTTAGMAQPRAPDLASPHLPKPQRCAVPWPTPTEPCAHCARKAGSGGKKSHTSGFVFMHSLDRRVQDRHELKHTHTMVILPGPSEVGELPPYLQELFRDLRLAREEGVPGPLGVATRYKPVIVHIDADTPAASKLMDTVSHTSYMQCPRCLLTGVRETELVGPGGSNRRKLHLGYTAPTSCNLGNGPPTPESRTVETARRVVDRFVPQEYVQGLPDTCLALRSAGQVNRSVCGYDMYPRLVRWQDHECCPEVDVVFGPRICYFHALALGIVKNLFKGVILRDPSSGGAPDGLVMGRQQRKIMSHRAAQCHAPPGGCPLYRDILDKSLNKAMSGWTGAEVLAWVQTWGPIVMRGLLNEQQMKLWKPLRDGVLDLMMAPSEREPSRETFLARISRARDSLKEYAAECERLGRRHTALAALCTPNLHKLVAHSYEDQAAKGHASKTSDQWIERAVQRVKRTLKSSSSAISPEVQVAASELLLTALLKLPPPESVAPQASPGLGMVGGEWYADNEALTACMHGRGREVDPKRSASEWAARNVAGQMRNMLEANIDVYIQEGVFSSREEAVKFACSARVFSFDKAFVDGVFLHKRGSTRVRRQGGDYCWVDYEGKDWLASVRGLYVATSTPIGYGPRSETAMLRLADLDVYHLQAQATRTPYGLQGVVDVGRGPVDEDETVVDISRHPIKGAVAVAIEGGKAYVASCRSSTLQ